MQQSISSHGPGTLLRAVSDHGIVRAGHEDEKVASAKEGFSDAWDDEVDRVIGHLGEDEEGGREEKGGEESGIEAK